MTIFVMDPLTHFGEINTTALKIHTDLYMISLLNVPSSECVV